MLWRKNKAREGGKGALEQEVGGGAVILNRHLRKWIMNKDLKEIRKQTLRVIENEPF